MNEDRITDMGRYVLEEWAEDYRKGQLGRREFLRRVVLFAGSTATAVPLLGRLGVAASAEEVSAATAQVPPPQATQGVTVPPDDPAIQVGMVTFAHDGTNVRGYLARPRNRDRAPGLVLCHENRGLVEHTRDVARRFAKVGYVALAVDLASHEGGTDRFGDPAAVTALLGRTPPAQLVGMLDGGVHHLRSRDFVHADRIGAIGWCFGGGMTWRLVTVNRDIRAAVPYYGPNPPLEDVPRIHAAVLGIYAEQDQRINAGIPALREALQRANVTHEIVIFPGVDHAFFNDTGARYNAAVARQAWERTLAWLQRYLGA
ncbi:MAG: dienelactone hydrolase family protein [Armatimonadota bacterium]|nr:dienelactone hydrolase family protein [Armatimonadota bacterium]MDR5696798.1 dienelactone hydrolase family protein [Armatimonadota bacterium]